MFNKLINKIYKKTRLIIIDLFLINFALFASFYLRFDGNWQQYFDIEYLFVITIISAIILYFSNLYNKMWKYASISELRSLIRASIIINSIFVVYIFLFQVRMPRSILIINGILDVFLLGGLRFSLRLLKDYLKINKNNGAKKNVLIVGAGDAAEMVVREMHKHPELNKEVIALVDDDPKKHGLEIHGVEVKGDRHDIPDLINRYNVKEIIIAIPSAKGSEIKEIFELSKEDEVEVNIVPGVFEILKGDINLNQIREVKVEDLLRRDPVELNTDNISSYIEGKTVLVTGGAGSIGSELCRQVARFNPEKLIIFDINENNTYFLELELKEEHKDLEIVPIIGSIRDKMKLEQTFTCHKPDVVFHAAAHKHVPLMEHNPEEAIKNNVLGTRNVAQVSAEFEIDRFVLVSTDKAVNPTNVMGASKRGAEMIVQHMNRKKRTKFMAVRFGNVLGSRGSVIPIFKRQIKEGGPVTVTHKDVTRYFMTIPEAAQLVIQAGSLGDGGEVFVLDMGDPVKIMELAEDLIELSGLEVGKDIEIEVVGLRPGEKLYEELLNDDEDNLATEHERIFITSLNSCDWQKLNKSLERLENLIDKGISSKIVDELVDMVGTYEPNRDKVKEINFAEEKKKRRSN
ncbi:MAG TPA: nucleoside-diphosphate sugar epimerase/dehydratase [Halanaerobiales bacterium]|nr:nucleoside-diphosphate sugar epimerase/dehydratase [Halanaerobiales bacterium]